MAHPTKNPGTNTDPGDDGANLTTSDARQGNRPNTMLLVLIVSITAAVVAGVMVASGFWS